MHSPTIAINVSVHAVINRPCNQHCLPACSHTDGAIALYGEPGLQQILDDPAVDFVVVVLPVQVALQVCARPPPLQAC